MTFLAAVAAGGDAVASLRLGCETRVAARQFSLVQDRELAVTWATGCRWIDSHDDGTVLVVLDGHLHNLSSSAQTQAELLRERYRELGGGIATGLLGDFVLIVLDRGTNTLLVARDPVGVRPWYHATAGRRHAGATDMATLTALPWVDTTVNESAAIRHLAAVSESNGETLYRGIRTLRPGETWLSRNGDVTTLRHHRWNVRPREHISWDEAAERCRDVLDEAVRCRLAVGGTATSELSGGLDSSAVVGTLALLGHDDIVAGRLVFEGGADERFYSDAVIDHWRARGVSAPPWMPSVEQHTEMTRRWLRPVPDPNFTMFCGLYRDLLDAGRAECLTGLGGDDAFRSRAHREPGDQCRAAP